MTVYVDDNLTYSTPRTHPWTVGESDARFRYIDFKSQPELIAVSLEDFRLFAHWPAVQRFYDFLTWINGPESQLETNDCALRPPRSHRDKNSEKKLSCHGRLFLFYRNIRYNLNQDACGWLTGAFLHTLSGLDSEFSPAEGVIGLTSQNASYIELPCREERDILGGQLMLSFWAYGNEETEVFANLNRVFANLWEAATLVSVHIRDEFDHASLA